MHLRSDSLQPYATFDPRLAFCDRAEVGHVTLSRNRSPHLAWSGVPEGVRSFALVLVDVDVPSEGTHVNQEGVTVPVDLPRVDFYHWVLADLPADVRELAEGQHSDGVTPRGKDAGPAAGGGVQGLNDYTGWFAGDPDMGGDYAGYDGPCPPWNDERVHGYRFILLALDVESLGLSGGFTGAELLAAAEGHVLARAELMGLYSLRS